MSGIEAAENQGKPPEQNNTDKGIEVAAYGAGTASVATLQQAIDEAWRQIKNDPEELAFMAEELQVDESVLRGMDSSPFCVETGKSGFVGGGVGEAILIFVGKVVIETGVILTADMAARQVRRVWKLLFVPKVQQEAKATALGQEVPPIARCFLPLLAQALCSNGRILQTIQDGTLSLKSGTPFLKEIPLFSLRAVA